jgi:hypothetical protein
MPTAHLAAHNPLFHPSTTSLAERKRKEATRPTGFSVRVIQKIFRKWHKHVPSAQQRSAEKFAGSTKETGLPAALRRTEVKTQRGRVIDEPTQ